MFFVPQRGQRGFLPYQISVRSPLRPQAFGLQYGMGHPTGQQSLYGCDAIACARGLTTIGTIRLVAHSSASAVNSR